MIMDGNIRVRTSAKHSEFYNDMKGVLVTDSHELFFIAACIAYKRGKRTQIEKSTDKFWSRTIKPDEWCTYYSMVLQDSEMDFSSIRDDTDVMRSVEEYANAGIEILADEWLDGFIHEKDGALIVDRTALAEMPKLLFYSLLEEGAKA